MIDTTVRTRHPIHGAFQQDAHGPNRSSEKQFRPICIFGHRYDYTIIMTLIKRNIFLPFLKMYGQLMKNL